MTRDEYKNIVLNSLLKVDPNKDYFYDRMVNHLNHSNKDIIECFTSNGCNLSGLTGAL